MLGDTMDNTAVHFLTVFMAFFAIMNPVANASLFVGLTQDSDSSTRRLIALRSVFVAFIIVSSFAIAGREIFSIFGITLPAFRIAGGLMIGAIGYHMLQGEQSTFHTPSDDPESETSFSAHGPLREFRLSFLKILPGIHVAPAIALITE